MDPNVQPAKITLHASRFTTERGRNVLAMPVRGHPWLFWDPASKRAHCERCGTITEIVQGLTSCPTERFGVAMRPAMFVIAWSRFVNEHLRCPE